MFTIKENDIVYNLRLVKLSSVGNTCRSANCGYCLKVGSYLNIENCKVNMSIVVHRETVN